jgi:hypothetical protein
MAVGSVQKSINASSTTGMRLDSAAGPVEIRLQPNDALYAVSNSGTQTVTLLTVGN